LVVHVVLVETIAPIWSAASGRAWGPDSATAAFKRSSSHLDIFRVISLDGYDIVADLTAIDSA